MGAALNQLAADIDSLGALALGIAAGPVQSDCRGEALSGSTRKARDAKSGPKGHPALANEAMAGLSSS